MKFKVKLISVNDVALFVKKCGDYEEDIDYIYGRYIIDAKSIMGILSTEIGDVCMVEIHTEDTNKIEKFKEEIKLWLVEE